MIGYTGIVGIYALKKRGIKGKMNIGCCENCRYLDLMENVDDDRGCPRCGGHMVSLGVGTRVWNRMGMSEREAVIRRRFKEAEAARGDGRPLIFQELDAEKRRKAEEQRKAEEKKKAKRAALIEAMKPRIRPEPEPDRELFTEAVEPLEPVAGTLSEALSESVPVLKSVPWAESEDDDVVYDKVYVCYKCNSIAGHDGAQDRYSCSECGSDMVDIGYTTKEWSDLSKEEKRQACEEAKIRHMVLMIKEASYDDGEEDSTPNIINVVPNKDKVYV